MYGYKYEEATEALQLPPLPQDTAQDAAQRYTHMTRKTVNLSSCLQRRGLPIWLQICIIPDPLLTLFLCSCVSVFQSLSFLNSWVFVQSPLFTTHLRLVIRSEFGVGSHQEPRNVSGSSHVWKLKYVCFDMTICTNATIQYHTQFYPSSLM